MVLLTTSHQFHCILWEQVVIFNTLRPGKNGRHFADDIFKCIFVNENVWIPIKISLKYISKGPINNIPALVQIMAWRRPGDKPLSEPMMVSLSTHKCVTQPQWVNKGICFLCGLKFFALNIFGGECLQPNIWGCKYAEKFIVKDVPKKSYELLNIQVCLSMFFVTGCTQSLVVCCKYQVVPLISTRVSGYAPGHPIDK